MSAPSYRRIVVEIEDDGYNAGIISDAMQEGIEAASKLTYLRVTVSTEQYVKEGR